MRFRCGLFENVLEPLKAIEGPRQIGMAFSFSRREAAKSG